MDRQLAKKFFTIFSIATVFILIILNRVQIWNYAASFWNIVYPFVVGIAIAYVANLPYGLFYDKVFAFLGDDTHKVKGKIRKPLSILLSYLFLAAIIAFVLVIIIPEIKNSVNMFSANIDSYVDKTRALLNKALAFFGYDKTNSTVTELLNDFSNFVGGGDLNGFFRGAVTKLFPHIYDITTGTISAIYTGIISIIVSIYMLSCKNSLIRQTKKIICALLPKKYIVRMLGFFSRVNRTVSRFIYGKILDSFIIGVMCFIGLSIFGFEYAALISIVIGITNIIPFFGPIIGAIPCTLLLLLINPIQALWFVVFILLLQQFDGNILGPKILGSAVGINGLWVMFGVIVGGGMFGFLGMVLGVPVFAVLYFALGEFVNDKLEKRSYTVESTAVNLNGHLIESGEHDIPSSGKGIFALFGKKRKSK